MGHEPTHSVPTVQGGKEIFIDRKEDCVLESIGFEWSLTTDWEDRYEELKKYKFEYGNCNVSQKWSENPQLGKWVTNQRTQYRLHREGKKSPMTEERIALLESIGFIWDAQEALWQQRYIELKDYKVKHDHCNLPALRSQNPQLATWVSYQRAKYRLYRKGKKSPMTEERIASLESIGFEWDLRTRSS